MAAASVEGAERKQPAAWTLSLTAVPAATSAVSGTLENSQGEF